MILLEGMYRTAYTGFCFGVPFFFVKVFVLGVFIRTASAFPLRGPVKVQL